MRSPRIPAASGRGAGGSWGNPGALQPEPLHPLHPLPHHQQLHVPQRSGCFTTCCDTASGPFPDRPLSHCELPWPEHPASAAATTRHSFDSFLEASANSQARPPLALGWFYGVFPWKDLSTPSGPASGRGQGRWGKAAQTGYHRFLGFNPKVCFDSTWLELSLLKKHNLSSNDAIFTEIKS